MQRVSEPGTTFEMPTPREQELIALIALGLQNKAIAYELHISPHTVRAHIGNIMRKYHLRNRTQIAMELAACARGVVETGDHPKTDGLFVREDATRLRDDGQELDRDRR